MATSWELWLAAATCQECKKLAGISQQSGGEAGGLLFAVSFRGWIRIS